MGKRLKNIQTFEQKTSEFNISDVRERLINYLNGRIRLIQSKYQMDEGDERIIDEILDIRTDIENNSF
jgi:hypothetical protein